MKTFITLISIGIVVICLSSCSNTERNKQRTENDSLRLVIAHLNESLNELGSSFDTITSNLDSMAAKEQILNAFGDKKSDLNGAVKEKLNSTISEINGLMAKNKGVVDKLNSKLKTSFFSDKYFGKIISAMNMQLNQKGNELQTLSNKLNMQNDQISKLQTDMFVLKVSNDSYSQVLEDEEAALHTAYYITGRTNYLEEMKLIELKGGLLGLGKTYKLSSNLDEGKFIKIDYNKIKSIPINSKKYKIITSHPTDTYTLKYSEVDKDYLLSIEISNPDKFWKASKYLVVSVN